ncbi:MAG: stage 0 sporulation protein [Lentisphaeria bacterium]|nr:stage 0 sporulation protein [Lentisphaeria bacterium]
MERVFLLKLENGATLEARAEISLEISPHDKCVFTRDFYTDMGEVCRELDPTKLKVAVPTLPQIQRIATPEDLAKAEENQEKNRTAMATTQTLVEQLGLEMKLINAHSSLDGKLMTIQFSADGRVDFRELIKELTRARCSRIELRQIGVRDETGIYGGIGVCGQTLCCSRFLKEFNSINVKMAKEQDLSLTPATISGACGRLKCCLKYEHDGYTELAKGMPRKGEYCETPDGPGRITDRNLLSRKVFVTLENGNVNQYPAEDIKISHNQEKRVGPGKKNNDPRRSNNQETGENNKKNRENAENREHKNRRSHDSDDHSNGETENSK